MIRSQLARALASDMHSRGGVPLRRTALAAVVGLLLVVHRTWAQSPDGRDWNTWPWMDAHIPPPVQLSARTASIDSARDFQGFLILYNPGRDSVRVTFGNCSFGLRLYRDNSLHTPPLWDNRLRPNVDCTLEGRSLTIGPGERREHVVWIARAMVAQAPLPGRYAATITWRPSTTAPVQDVPAGIAVIR